MATRTIVAVALLLVMGAASPAWSGDVEDCADGSLLKTEPARVAAACRRLATQGNAQAQHNLGFLYASGQGVPLDYAEALQWYRKAADQGNAFAQSNLGVAYAGGQGVPRDLAEAAKWFRKAADQNNAVAQFVLGHMYASGEGVARDYVQTYKWWSLAAAQGNSDATANLGRVAAMMTTAQIDQGKALAAAWKPTTGQ